METSHIFDFLDEARFVFGDFIDIWLVINRLMFAV